MKIKKLTIIYFSDCTVSYEIGIDEVTDIVIFDNNSSYSEYCVYKRNERWKIFSNLPSEVEYFLLDKELTK